MCFRQLSERNPREQASHQPLHQHTPSESFLFEMSGQNGTYFTGMQVFYPNDLQHHRWNPNFTVSMINSPCKPLFWGFMQL
jgi:hypothetical protein